jgi:hypothetical protein
MDMENAQTYQHCIHKTETQQHVAGEQKTHLKLCARHKQDLHPGCMGQTMDVVSIVTHVTKNKRYARPNQRVTDTAMQTKARRKRIELSETTRLHRRAIELLANANCTRKSAQRLLSPND